ncbi:hypothetical protein H8F23_26555 [Pseudomonas sp. P155]|uniref:Uncharacterized protein n=1 Tax=Pseudomonas neuropathica TaxID=2730425 RepID=A0ABS0BQW0_9PSED|nr:hypothetical protein [Pseudomonas neuropathica]MBF6036827.1 hypothetical protein [Pseudomonas neuropathica]
MAEIKTFIDAIPAPLWGIIGTAFGAILTLTAALVLNSGNNKRLKIQLRHDEREKNTDRMNAMRREVYMDAIAEMVKVGRYLGDLPRIDIANKNISSDLQDFYVAAAKLSLVSSDETQKAVDALGIEYSKLIFVLMQRATPLHAASSEMKLHAKYFDEFMSSVTRVTAGITNFNEAARTEQNIFAALERSFNFFMSQARIQEEQRAEAHTRFNDLYAEYNRLLMSDMRQISKLQVEVLIAIRRDLGVATDEQHLRNRALNHYSEISKSVDDAIDEIQSH